jgi:hypothetical protein
LRYRPSEPRGVRIARLYANPNTAGAKLAFKPRYDNFIGGQFVPPAEGPTST